MFAGTDQVARGDRPGRLGNCWPPAEDLLDGTARGRGTTQHRNRLGWDSFGTNVSVGVLGSWLADLPADRWSAVGQRRQTRSGLEWPPEYGDRASYLSPTGVGLDLRE